MSKSFHLHVCIVNIYSQYSAGTPICPLNLVRILEGLNEWTSLAPQLLGDSSPGCQRYIGVCFKSASQLHLHSLHITNWKCTIAVIIDKFIVKRSRLEVPQQETVPPPLVKLPLLTDEVVAAAGSGSAHAHPENDGRGTTACRPIGKRPFNYRWLTTYPWLIYDEQSDKAFCKTCQNANQKRLLESSTFVKRSFISDGFSNWKHAVERFNGHEKSDCHRTAVSTLASAAGGVNVHSSLSKAKREDMVAARISLHHIVSSLAYLAKQGLAIRGKTDSTANFNELLALRATDVSELQSWLSRTKYRWISHDIQNEMLNILADRVLDRILLEVTTAQWYSIMVDETTDCSRNEQMVFCFRICDAQLQVYELFVGFRELEQQDSETLFATVKRLLEKYNVNISNCRGQCFDGAANVAGHLNGLQAKIRDVEPRAMYTYTAQHTV